MKKFKYKIDSYLKYLKHQREEALREVHKAQAVKLQLEEKYQWMENDMKKAYERNSQFGQGLSDVNLINDNNQFMSMLKLQMQDLSNEIAMAEEVYQEKYKKLLELQMEVKKIELHREKKFQEYKAEYNKKVQKQTDEINSARRGA